MSHNPNVTAVQIQSALRGPLEPVQVTLVYRVAIGLVALCMLLLPAVYLGLIGLTAYGLIWHAVNDASVFSHTRSAKGALMMYLTPLIVGGTLLLFMIKPLFAPRPVEPPPVSIERDQQPELFCLVEQLCRLVGAPFPSRIDLTCDVNASASFRRGMWSLFRNDLVLTIGLPLVSGLTLRQLTGVLAHEFGHFAQGSGMRVSYIIRSVNAWFARVVYTRDQWDQRLTSASENNDIRLGIVFYVARFFVWLTRLILRGLMYTGHLLSCFLLRHMEFDADRYEARVAGSQVFGETARRLPLLSAARSGAIADLAGSWQNRQLTDDFVAVVMHNFARLPAKVSTAIEEHIAGSKTGLFDTHPCDRERIASAEAERAAGTFQLELPATALFRDFDAVARRCSLALYAEQLEHNVCAEHLVPSQTFLAQQRERDAEIEALHALCGHPVDAERALALDFAALGAPSDLQAERAAMRKARAAIDAVRERAVEQLSQVGSLHRRWVSFLQAAALLKVGMKIDAKSFGLEKGEFEHATQRASEARTERFAEPALCSVDAAVTAYLTAGLRAAHALALPETARLEETLRAYALLMAHQADIHALEHEFFGLAAVLNNLESNQGIAGLRDAVLGRSETLLATLRSLRLSLSTVPYPFEHVEQGVSLGHALIQPVPSDPEQLGDAMSAAGGSLERIERARARCVARMLRAALAAETALDDRSRIAS